MLLIMTLLNLSSMVKDKAVASLPQNAAAVEPILMNSVLEVLVDAPMLAVQEADVQVTL